MNLHDNWSFKDSSNCSSETFTDKCCPNTSPAGVNVHLFSPFSTKGKYSPSHSFSLHIQEIPAASIILFLLTFFLSKLLNSMCTKPDYTQNNNPVCTTDLQYAVQDWKASKNLWISMKTVLHAGRWRVVRKQSKTRQWRFSHSNGFLQR